MKIDWQRIARWRLSQPAIKLFVAIHNDQDCQSSSVWLAKPSGAIYTLPFSALIREVNSSQEVFSGNTMSTAISVRGAMLYPEVTQSINNKIRDQNKSACAGFSHAEKLLRFSPYLLVKYYNMWFQSFHFIDFLYYWVIKYAPGTGYFLGDSDLKAPLIIQ